MYNEMLWYFQEWMAGDIIGVLIDIDEGEISYTRFAF